MVMGQSIVLSAIKTEVLLDCDDPANQDLLVQQYEERIERLSQPDKLSKLCMDAGFTTVKLLLVADFSKKFVDVQKPVQSFFTTLVQPCSALVSCFSSSVSIASSVAVLHPRGWFHASSACCSLFLCSIHLYTSMLRSFSWMNFLRVQLKAQYYNVFFFSSLGLHLFGSTAMFHLCRKAILQIHRPPFLAQSSLLLVSLPAAVSAV